MTDTEHTIATPPSPKKLVLGVAAAVGVAAVALVVFILPAEYGIDPTGAGKALGVTKLAGGDDENIYLKRGLARKDTMFPLNGPVALDDGETTIREQLSKAGLSIPARATMRRDSWQHELAPYGSIEMKYQLEKGQPMVFTWRAAKPVHVDMHSFPFDGGDEATESFVIEDSLGSQSAVYVAPFTGMHGWYWENRNLEDVTLTVEAVGSFTGAKTWEQGVEADRALSPGD